MEATQVQHLSQCLLSTLSPDSEIRRTAEKLLSDAAGLPNYGLTVLRVVAESQDKHIRHAASVNFKNHIRSRWPRDGCSGVSPIADSEKEQIKTHIVPLMESSLSPLIKIQLSEALIVMGNNDYLNTWPNFLPRLIYRLQMAALSNDYTLVNCILGTANSIFNKFRQDDQLDDLDFCHDTCYLPLLEIFKSTFLLIESTLNSTFTEVNLKSLIECQELCCGIFLSFNFPVLPQIFKDHMYWLMSQFAKLLSPFPNLEPAEIAEAVVDLRYAVIANINLYMEKYEIDFEEFVNGFVRIILITLKDLSNSPSMDKFATAAIRFLMTVSTSRHHVLFSDDNVIKEICLGVVIPNISMTAEDEYLFEMNYKEFIRRDMEPSGVYNRRRMSSKLLEGLATNYARQVMGVLLPELQKLHTSFSNNQTELWKNEVCVIDLVIPLAGDDMFRLIYQKIFLSLLHSIEDRSSPMLQAGSLKFLAMLSGRIEKQTGINLFKDLARLLQADSKVVHSYAAICIEKLLLVQEEALTGDIDAVVIMTNLFDALKITGENDYILKCLMRVLSVAEISGEAAEGYIVGLTSILSELCKTPKSPVFNRFLFECIAVILRKAYEGDMPLIPAFERVLFPSVKVILDKQMAHFMPYAFQLMAQLLELNIPTLSDKIVDIFWLHVSNLGRITGLLRLFVAILPRAVREGFNELNMGLRVAEICLSSPKTEDEGFDVLQALFMELKPTVTDMEQVLGYLFETYPSRSETFKKSFLLFMSVIVVVRGSSYIEKIDEFVQRFWIPMIKHIRKWTRKEKKLLAAATSTILADMRVESPCADLSDSICTMVLIPEDEGEICEEGLHNARRRIGYCLSL